MFNTAHFFIPTEEPGSEADVCGGGGGSGISILTVDI